MQLPWEARWDHLRMGCSSARHRNPSQGVVLVAGLFVNLPHFGFPSFSLKYSFWGLYTFTDLFKTVTKLIPSQNSFHLVHDLRCHLCHG